MTSATLGAPVLKLRCGVACEGVSNDSGQCVWCSSQQKNNTPSFYQLLIASITCKFVLLKAIN